MELVKVLAHQVRLVQHDQIPLSSLLNQSNLFKLRNLFNFSNAEVAQSSSNDLLVRFTGGLFPKNGKSSQIIDLAIFERKMITSIEGNSEDIDAMFDKVNAALHEISGADWPDYLNPIVTADESEIVAKFDFEFDNLFSTPFNRFINSQLSEEIKLGTAKPLVKPKDIKFDIDYLSDDKNLKDYNIQLSKKEFAFSPRPGYPLTERVFYSKAPLKSSDHLRLLKTLEVELTKISK